jgi:hypothetical protein
MIKPTVARVVCDGVMLTANIVSRFWDKVRVTDGCWLWTAPPTTKGYGQLSRKPARPVLAHRLSWFVHHGHVPAGLHVLHNCPGGDNKLCVNPAHLWIGTNADNHRDGARKGQYVKTISDEQVLEIRSRAAAGETFTSIAKALGVCRQTAGRIACGIYRPHVHPITKE